MKFKKHVVGVLVILFVMAVLIVVNNQARIRVSQQSIQVEGTLTIEMKKVFITGEVVNPGVYEMADDERLNILIEKAGGFTEEARTEGVNLARVLKDGEMITIYKEGIEVVYTGLDLFNFGDEDALENIDGVGEVLAQRIVEYRKKNGYFTSFEDLLNVEGIGDQKLQSIMTSLEN